jgi:hypothetical protein
MCFDMLIWQGNVIPLYCRLRFEPVVVLCSYALHVPDACNPTLRGDELHSIDVGIAD